MKDNRNGPTLSAILMIMLIGGTLILPGTASFISDPYGDSCVFDGDQVEEALIQPGSSSQGMFCFTINPDNIVMIGDYIRETYPDIWELLSPESQEYYNSVAAVWPCGEDEPMLPNEVIRLLRRMQTGTVGPTLHEQEMQKVTSAVQQTFMVPDISSRFTTENIHIQERYTAENIGAMPDVSDLVMNTQFITERLVLKDHDSNDSSGIGTIHSAGRISSLSSRCINR